MVVLRGDGIIEVRRGDVWVFRLLMREEAFLKIQKNR